MWPKNEVIYDFNRIYKFQNKDEYIIFMTISTLNKANIFGDYNKQRIYLYYDGNNISQMELGGRYMCKDGGSQKLILNGAPLTIPHNNPWYGPGLPLEYKYEPLIDLDIQIDAELCNKIKSYLDSIYLAN